MQKMKINISNSNITLLKQKALVWANAQSEVLCYLDTNDYQEDKYSKYDCLLAVGVEQDLMVMATGTAFEQLKRFATSNKKWLFGHFNYDLKNETEQLQSENEDLLCFPELYFFVPSYLCIFHKNKQLEILSTAEAPIDIWDAIQAQDVPSNSYTSPSTICSLIF